MKSSLREYLTDIFLISALGSLLFGLGMGNFSLLDTNEPFYSLTAKEMLQRKDISTPVIFGHPQFEKPILFYWVIYACFQWFGISEASARLGPAIAGALTLCVTYLWARLLFKRRQIAAYSTLILATALEFIALSRVVFTDIFLCLFVSAALYFFTLGYFKAHTRPWSWKVFFAFLGLGFLTKGILGFFLPVAAIIFYSLWYGEKKILKEIPWGWGIVIFALTGLPWYVLTALKFGAGFLDHFFIHENVGRFFVAEHKNFDRFYFYPLVVFLGFFPWTFLVVPSIFHGISRIKKTDKSYQWLFSILVTFFVFFMIAKSKLVSYIFPLFPALALILGRWTYTASRNKKILKTVFLWSITTLALPAAALGAGALIYDRNISMGLFYPIAMLSILLLGIVFVFLWILPRRSLRQAVFFLGISISIFYLLIFGWFLPKADPFFSCKQFVESYRRHSGEASPGFLLASKLFVRGVSYYSGHQNMGVLTDKPKHVFYTPHSIPMISSKEDLLKIEQKYFPVYCFIRDKEYRFLNSLIDHRFRLVVLEDHEKRMLARLDRVN